ncbi:hypothetical protein SKAU_G00023500 [Synaphobranchus kaupii]|uniref:Uncharacterized protein n=1 Tax=Synaphobranchus kaupii TaxID=118154 RepID=A0A9Q1GE57_SYNKA|nr:hypothetical protein SKAU_G00023500 [Synaphobranchus kaupii]
MEGGRRDSCCGLRQNREPWGLRANKDGENSLAALSKFHRKSEAITSAENTRPCNYAAAVAALLRIPAVLWTEAFPRISTRKLDQACVGVCWLERSNTWAAAPHSVVGYGSGKRLVNSKNRALTSYPSYTNKLLNTLPPPSDPALRGLPNDCNNKSIANYAILQDGPLPAKTHKQLAANEARLLYVRMRADAR